MANHRSDQKPAPAGIQGDQPGSPPATPPRAEIDRFLDQVKDLSPTTKTGQRGRLIFALDATMSRQPTWDLACKLQADMFRAAAAVGGLDIQLVYFIAAWWNAAPRPGLLIRIDWAH
jgi:hypothetical protein